MSKTSDCDELHRAMHDLGGSGEHRQFIIDEHEPGEFDKDVDALVNLLATRDVALVRPDERRRGIEELTEDIYFQSTYYQRWLLGVTAVLIEKGILDPVELAQSVARLTAGES